MTCYIRFSIMRFYSASAIFAIIVLGLLLNFSTLLFASTNGDYPLTIVKQQSLPHQTSLFELSNGLTVLIAEDHSAPVASARCFVKNTGSAFEGAWLGSGVSHLLEHLAAGGTTTKRTEKEIEHLVERMGGVTNAYTSTDITCYYIDSTAAHVATTIELVADMVLRATIEPTEFAREHKVVTQELLDGENDRGRVMWHLLSQTSYLESPERHPVIGYYDNLSRLTRDDVIAFYRERYVPNNMVFVVAGDVNTREVIELIMKQFEDIPRGVVTSIAMATEPQQIAPRSAHREMDGKTIQFALAWGTVELSHADACALDVLAYMLSEGDSSRLVRNLVYQQQLLLTVGAVHHTPPYVAGQFCLFGLATPEKYTEASQALLAEVARIQTSPPTMNELAKAKKQKEAEIIFGRQRAKEVASGLGRNFCATGDPLYDEQYIEDIRRVTPEDVLRVASYYFKPERMTSIVIAPKGELPTTGTSQISSDRDALVSRVLPNGLRVFVKRQSNLPLVDVRAFVYGGMVGETHETAGLGSLLSSMLDQGTKMRGAEEIAEYFDSIGGTIGMSCGRYSFSGRVTVLADDFEKSTEVLADCLFHSTFPEKEFEQMKTITLGSIAHRRDNPVSEMLEFFTESLPQDSIYSILDEGTTESVNQLTPAALREAHLKSFVPHNMVVTVFGDIDVDKAFATVERFFTSGAEIGNLIQIAPEVFPPAPLEPGEKHRVTEKDAGMVLLAYHSPSYYDTQDYYAMRVLSAMMSDGTGPNGWLFNDLRGAGLVYRVNTSIRTGRVPGYFLVIAQTSPDSIKEVVSRIESHFARAIAGDFPQDDLERAQERLVLQHAQKNVTIGEQSQVVGLDVLLGFGPDHDSKHDEHISAVTRDEIIAVANKYFKKRLVITTSPTEIKR